MTTFLSKSGSSPPSLQQVALNPRIRAELIKHGATPEQADEYCAMVRKAVDDSKNWDGIVTLHHILPENCGWWCRFRKVKWNLAPVAYPLHVMLHAQLVFMFPLHRSFRAALHIVGMKQWINGDEKVIRWREQICVWYAAGKTTTWIAKQIGMHRCTVKKWIRAWRVPMRTLSAACTDPKKAKFKDRIINWYGGGKTLNWIASRVEVSDGTICNWLRDWGIRVRGHSEASTHPKKTKHKTHIIAWYSAGESCTRIGEQLGVTGGSIARWLHEWEAPIRRRGESKVSPKKAKHKNIIIEWYRAGKSPQWIGKQIGVSSSAIRAWTSEWAIPTFFNHRKITFKTRVIKWYQTGKSTLWIADQVGVSASQIPLWLHEWRVHVHAASQPNAKKAKYKTRIVAWYAAGETLGWISKQVGMSEQAISDWMCSWKVPTRGVSQTKVRLEKARYKDSICQWYKAGKSARWISEQVGVSDGCVSLWLREWKVPSYNSRLKTTYKDRIISWCRAGKTLRWIGEQIGAGNTTIYGWLREWKVPAFRNHQKLTYKARVIGWHQAGKSLVWMAERVGVHQTTIGLWLRKWKETPELQQLRQAA